MVKTGFDHFSATPLLTNPTQLTAENCLGGGEAFLGGPACHFQGKDIPSLTQWSEGGGIAPQILTNILKRMGNVRVLNRTNGVELFLLVDAYGFQMSVKFLQYINDNSHPWKVCNGVPYGTHL